MLDGNLGDSEGYWIVRGIALMKRLIFSDDLYVDINQASEVTCSSPECSSVDSILTSCGNWGHLLNLA